MKYKDVKNYTWYKITSIGNKQSDREFRYIYKTDFEDGNRDIIAGLTRVKENYNFYWMTLSKSYWERHGRVEVEEDFPEDLNQQEVERKLIKELFDVGIE